MHLSQEVDDEELVATMLEKALSDYASILATETKIQGANLMLQDLFEAMDTEY